MKSIYKKYLGFGLLGIGAALLLANTIYSLRFVDNQPTTEQIFQIRMVDIVSLLLIVSCPIALGRKRLAYLVAALVAVIILSLFIGN